MFGFCAWVCLNGRITLAFLPGGFDDGLFCWSFFPVGFRNLDFCLHGLVFLALVLFAADSFTLGLVVVFAADLTFTATFFSVVAFGLILVAIRRQSPS